MPPLKHPREELFCQYRAQGHSQIDAYRMAGGKANYGETTKSGCPSRPSILDNQERVRQRVAELLSEKQAKNLTIAVEISREALVGELWAIKQDAIAKGRHSEAINAIKEIGVLTGLRVEKTDTTTHNDVDELSNADAQKLLDYASRKDGAQKLQN
jgi:hypothetical protein